MKSATQEARIETEAAARPLAAVTDERLEDLLSAVLRGDRGGEIPADAAAVVSEVVLRWRAGIRRGSISAGRN